MKLGFETLPRPAQFGLFGFGIFAIGLLCALLYRAVTDYDVVVGHMQQAQNAYALTGALDRRGSAYTIRPDGAVLLPHDQAEHLMADGTTFPRYERVERFPVQVALIVLLLAGVFWCMRMAMVLSRTYFARWGDGWHVAVKTRRVASEPHQAKAVSPMPENERKRLALLAHEHPQCVAVYLEQIAAEEAAVLLEQMAPEERMEIWGRMVDSRECDPQLRTALMQLFARKHAAWQRQQRSDATAEQLIAIYKALSQAVQPAFLAAVRLRQDDPLLRRLTHLSEAD